MGEAIRRRLNDSPAARWTVLFIVATAMMMGYFVNDVMSPLETLLEAPRSQGGLGWTPSDYGFFSGAGSFINVFLLMLFFSGLILDKMGIRFTGVLACSLMVIGTLLKLYGVTTDFGPAEITVFGFQLPMSVAVSSLGFSIFGVGYEMTGITVSKAMVRWFTGHELALAMGIQLAMARLGTAAALSISAPIARHFTLSTPLLVSLAFLLIGLLAFLVFCVMACFGGLPPNRFAGLPRILRDGSPTGLLYAQQNIQLRGISFFRYRHDAPQSRVLADYAILRIVLFCRLTFLEVFDQANGDEIWCRSRYRRFLLKHCTIWHDTDDTTVRTCL